jgi:hypothetical protein
MAAGFEWCQSTGAGNTVSTLGSSGNLFNWKSIDDATAADYNSHPITAGQDSFEVFLRAHMIGTFNRVSGFRFWLSTPFSPATGLQIMFTGTQQIYLQPASGTSSLATSSIPTADPGSTNVSIGGNLSGSLVASGYSDYIVTQLQTTTLAAAGDTSLSVMTLSYVENLRCAVRGPRRAHRNIQRLYHRDSEDVRNVRW